MSRASKIYITWPFNIQIAEINLNQNTTKRIFHPEYSLNLFRTKIIYETEPNKKFLH
jgi:hypothetical protein